MSWYRRQFLRLACWWYGRAIAHAELAGMDTLHLRLQHAYCQAWLVSGADERMAMARHVRLMCRKAFDKGMHRDELSRWVDRLSELEFDIRRAQAN